MVIICRLSASVTVRVCAGMFAKCSLVLLGVCRKNRKDYAYKFYSQCVVAFF